MNGKGLWTALIGILFGTYSDQVGAEEFVKPPPSGNVCSPAILGFKGKRMLMVTEMEGGDRLKSSWLKRLRDQTTVIKARTLFKELVSFNPMFLLMISSNLDIEWSSTDGGIKRSLACVPWPIRFGNTANDAENRRIGNPELKTEAKLKEMAPEFFFVLRAVNRVFFKDIGSSTIVIPRPYDVVTLTTSRMDADTKGSLDDFLTTKINKVTSEFEAHTDAKIIRSFCSYATELTKEAATKLLFTQVYKAIVNGKRILKFKNTAGTYLQLKDEPMPKQ
jgi:hypothetical protein